MYSDMTHLQRLEHMGFRLCAQWQLVDNGLKCAFIDHADDRNVLYTFVSQGVVLYIGKTVQSLRKRMYGYEKPGPTQSTNIKGNARILASVSAGIPIEVHVLPDNGLLYYGGYHVNLAAGLEDSLVRQIAPAWNRTGK